MRDKLFRIFSAPIAVILIILITATLTLIDGNLAYFFGLAISIIFFWASKFRWSEFGLFKAPLIKTIYGSFILALCLVLFNDLILQPIIEKFFGSVNLSEMDSIRGNFNNYIFYILISWVFAAFGEEFIYRGLFMKKMAMILGDTDKAWLVSAMLISIVFGLAHFYQGPSGVITTSFIGFGYSLIFYKNRKNLLLVIFTHGFYNTIGITQIFLNKERVIIDWVQQFL